MFWIDPRVSGALEATLLIEEKMLAEFQEDRDQDKVIEKIQLENQY